jgi:Uma2 family endonuclease
MLIEVAQALEAKQPESQEELEEMAGGEHGEISMLLGGSLVAYVYPNKLGRVFDGQTTLRISGTSFTRRPDVAFVSLERMPQRIREEIPFPPDLAVEIVSPTDSADEVDEKVLQ